MSTVEMEVFSNSQLVVMTILILLGGEVFISMFRLLFLKSNFNEVDNKVDFITVSSLSLSSPKNMETQTEFGLVPSRNLENKSSITLDGVDMASLSMVSDSNLKSRSLRYLSYVVLGYLLVFLVGGSVLVELYITLVPSTSNLLKNKGLQVGTFSVFTVVSTFANCGFVPTNENMIAFKNNPGLLLLLIPQVLCGNTLYPSFLRVVIWVLQKITRKQEFTYMLHYPRAIGYDHLVPNRRSLLLAFTVTVFILLQLVLFCSLEWNSVSLSGMSSYQKIVGGLFQVVNTRHTGESIVDLSIISPAILVMFVFMMYLPSSTSFLPIEECEKMRATKKKQRRKLWENLLFSQLSYLVICVTLICITERKDMEDDPLNFSVFNIVIEVVSAYGGVGYTTGYSCKKQINSNRHCEDKWYGFSGRWSNGGKLILILVMFLGRLKKFNLAGGKAWKLS